MNKSIFWHRRDLRIEDNAGLFKGLQSGNVVQPIFIFDKNILDKLPSNDQRVLFIFQYVNKLKIAYQNLGSDLWVFYGNPLEIIPEISEDHGFESVFTNRDYEPYALERDKAIYEKLQTKGIEFIGTKDHVIFEKNEVLKDDGKPYTVFTPYSRKWKSKLSDASLQSYAVEEYFQNLNQNLSKNEIMEYIEKLDTSIYATIIVDGTTETYKNITSRKLELSKMGSKTFKLLPLINSE
jgi:deoxyribodipyrimidine photo-lyase